VSGLGGTIGSSAAAGAVSTGAAVTQLESETSRNLDVTARFDGARFSTALTAFVNDIDGNIQKYALILPPGAVGTELGGQPIVAQAPTGTVFVSLSTNPVLARVNVDNVRIWGLEYTLNWTPTRTWQGSAVWTYLHAEDCGTGLPPNVEGGTPATGGVFKLRYTRPSGRAWVEPYVRAALRQTRLSSLDLEDRRTGATRSRTSIRNFFLNGATFRGYVGPGSDGRAGTADDVLLATGETLAEIQERVLGAATSAPLYADVPAYATVNLRGGFRVGKRQDVTVEVENLTDQNYRGVSWGMDAPGVNVYCTYRISF
jgi:hemoglobin/transferrin/lactoferrin receptor protein